LIQAIGMEVKHLNHEGISVSFQIFHFRCCNQGWKKNQ
jgi:hypothetical protein